MALANYAFHGNFEEVKRLIKNGSDINEKGREGNTALSHASTLDIKIVKYLVQHNCLLDETNNYGCTALMVACSANNPQIVKYLVKHNCLINIQDYEGLSALMWNLSGNYGYDYEYDYGSNVFMNKRYKICKCLIKHGSFINVKNKFRKTAISYAEYYKEIKYLQKIVLKRIKI